MKLLVVEDNPRLSARMKQLLRKWHVVETALSGHDGIHQAQIGTFDVIILDLGLPDMPGLDVCEAIRETDQLTPILVLTGVDATASRVALLEAGADDYITKPFETPELQARINALARRKVRGATTSTLAIGDLTIHPESRTVKRGGVEISLRRKEFDILEYLVRSAGRVLSRELIVHHAWPTESSGWIGSVDVHIKQIRDKVDRPFNSNLIKTVYGVGYTIHAEENSAHLAQDRRIPA